jgi:hypothetical protein
MSDFATTARMPADYFVVASGLQGNKCSSMIYGRLVIGILGIDCYVFLETE